MIDDLNKFMAEQVMGWEYSESRPSTSFYQHGDELIRKDQWTPTEDMNQAMMCAEKMAGRWFVEIHSTINGASELCWWVKLKPKSDKDRFHHGANKSPALAICQAIEESLKVAK